MGGFWGESATRFFLWEHAWTWGLEGRKKAAAAHWTINKLECVLMARTTWNPHRRYGNRGRAADVHFKSTLPACVTAKRGKTTASLRDARFGSVGCKRFGAGSFRASVHRLILRRTHTHTRPELLFLGRKEREPSSPEDMSEVLTGGYPSNVADSR